MSRVYYFCHADRVVVSGYTCELFVGFCVRVETAYCRVLLAVLSGKGSVVDIEEKCDGGTAIIHFLFCPMNLALWWVVLLISDSKFTVVQKD